MQITAPNPIIAAQALSRPLRGVPCGHSGRDDKITQAIDDWAPKLRSGKGHPSAAKAAYVSSGHWGLGEWLCGSGCGDDPVVANSMRLRPFSLAR